MCDLNVLSVFCKMHRSHSKIVLVDKLGSRTSYSCWEEVESFHQNGVLVLVCSALFPLALEPRLRSGNDGAL